MCGRQALGSSSSTKWASSVYWRSVWQTPFMSIYVCIIRCSTCLNTVSQQVYTHTHTRTHAHHNCKHVAPIKHVTSAEGQCYCLIGSGAKAMNSAQCTVLCANKNYGWLLTASRDVMLTRRNFRYLVCSFLKMRQQALPEVRVYQSKRCLLWRFLTFRTRFPP